MAKKKDRPADPVARERGQVLGSAGRHGIGELGAGGPP